MEEKKVEEKKWKKKVWKRNLPPERDDGEENDEFRDLRNTRRHHESAQEAVTLGIEQLVDRPPRLGGGGRQGPTRPCRVCQRGARCHQNQVKRGGHRSDGRGKCRGVPAPAQHQQEHARAPQARRELSQPRRAVEDRLPSSDRREVGVDREVEPRERHEEADEGQVSPDAGQREILDE